MSIIKGCLKKVRYKTLEGAIKSSKRQLDKNNKKLRPYYCSICFGYHLTSQSFIASKKSCVIKYNSTEQLMRNFEKATGVLFTKFKIEKRVLNLFKSKRNVTEFILNSKKELFYTNTKTWEKRFVIKKDNKDFILDILPGTKAKIYLASLG